MAIFKPCPYRRFKPKAVGSPTAHLDDNRLSYEERKERFINRVRSELPKIAEAHDDFSAKLQRRCGVK